MNSKQLFKIAIVATLLMASPLPALADDATGGAADAPQTTLTSVEGGTASDGASDSGEVATEGWSDDHTHYLRDGVTLTGVVRVDEKNWLFDETDGQLVAEAGWHKLSDGTWVVTDADGSCRSGWYKSGRYWYFLDEETSAMLANTTFARNGVTYVANVTGVCPSNTWAFAQGSWYRTNGSSACVSGWAKVGGKWYYFNPDTFAMETGLFSAKGVDYVASNSGDCAANAWVQTDEGWYRTNGSSACVKGWVKVGASWYYFDPANHGLMATGVFTVRDKSYVAKSSGACPANAWVQVGTDWYRTDASSACVTGWRTIGGKTYYFDPADSGRMATGTTDVDGAAYKFADDGSLISSIWVSADDGTAFWIDSDGTAFATDATISSDGTVTFPASYAGTAVVFGETTFVIGSDGTLGKGIVAANKGSYYCDPMTGAVRDGWIEDNGSWYYANPQSGLLASGWTKVGRSWYYMNADHSMFEGWLKQDSKWYYLKPGSGAMSTGSVVVDGKTRNFLSSGVCTSAGYQNPSPYYAINGVKPTPRLGTGKFSYVSPLRIGYEPTRSQVVEAFITNALGYLGSPYVWDYACAPGVGVDCAGLVLQCMYSVGMNPAGYSPYDHFYTPGHNQYANKMWNDARIKKVPLASRQRGDLIFWPGHVAIYLGNDQIIEAAMASGNVRYNTIYAYPKLGITGVGRLFN